MRNFVRKLNSVQLLKNLLLLLLVLVGLAACSTSTDKTAPQATAMKEGHAEVTPRPAAGQEIETDTALQIKFEEFSMIISRFVAEDEEGLLDNIQQDSVTIWGALAESIEGQTIRFDGFEQLEDLKIEQCYETSVTIMDEGPHCDLLDWKHFTSPWKTLRQTEAGLFRCLGYTLKEHEKFPEVSTAELKEAVKEHCGEEWSEAVKHPLEYPAGVGISTYFLRISGKKDGASFVKIIAIYSPMGC